MKKFFIDHIFNAEVHDAFSCKRAKLNLRNVYIEPTAGVRLPTLVGGARVAIAVTMVGMIVLPVAAQVAPAEEYIRQQERERALREQLERTPDVRLPQSDTPQSAERLPMTEPDCILIKFITLVGDSADQFQWAIAAANRTIDHVNDQATGRCLGTRGINLVMRRIQNVIIARGYVAARVLVAPQMHLNEGILELTLFPGRVRQIRFAPGTDSRATQWNAIPIKSGDLLNLRAIEQALENFKRVPTAEADIQITPAEGQDAEPGQSDLVISWRQGIPFRVSFSADDSGTKSTGKYQASATLSYDHWWTLNDLFYLSLNHDMGGGAPGPRGTRGYTVHYSVPYDYWLLGFTASENHYHQTVAGASQSYNYSGNSQNNDVKISRLIYRDALRKTTVFLKGWARASKNFIDDTEVIVQRRRVAGVDGGLSHREFIGSATLDANLNYRRGTGARGSLSAPEEAFGEGTSRPKMITADSQLVAPLSLGEQRLRYTGAWRAQWNRTPLVTQDRFSIGNRYTVRGFSGENQLLAERGWLVRNELGVALGKSGQESYIGVDYGQVGGHSSDALIGKHLSGAVLGLRGSLKSVTYDVFVGQSISKPSGFKTPTSVAGFSLNWSI